ncbi:hypothetical protein [Aquirhabdus sp.]|uniref:hypothetical protein n=1 Tax=Aquirhabdus sp. TaxID=2824160 RepID=UPI00396C32E7
MRLSASINFFNGEELLWHAVLNMRPLVEHLSIVYQRQSNWGQEISASALAVLTRLQQAGLVDDLICYEPDLTLRAAENEFRKRRIGLDVAIANQASHFLLMDADEFYLPDQFLAAKQQIEDEEIYYSCVSSYFYLHQPIYRSAMPDTTNVCFIAKIDEGLIFEGQSRFPVEHVDPTRRLIHATGRFKRFDVDCIAMHHMNFVRSNFVSKLSNTSSASNRAFIESARIALHQWSYPAPFKFPNKPSYNIICVSDAFDLKGIGFRPKRALIATSRLFDLAGSELYALELHQAFSRMGFSVDLYAFKFGGKLHALARSLDIDIRLLADLPESSTYDLVWIQHWPTYAYVFQDKQIHAAQAFYTSLGPTESLECPPMSLLSGHQLLVNSQENQDWLAENVPEYVRMSQVFPNAAPDEFLNFEAPVRLVSTKKNIAIVTNHLCPELAEAMQILQKHHDIVVDHIGLPDHMKPVTPALLAKYDAIVSIGKTVQYALVLGLPVYCYDHFGGPGWLSMSNVEQALYYNFSGRQSRQCTAQQIVQELCEIPCIPHHQHALKQWSRSHFSLTVNLKSLLHAPKTQSLDYDAEGLSFQSTANLQKRLLNGYLSMNKDLYIVHGLHRIGRCLPFKVKEQIKFILRFTYMVLCLLRQIPIDLKRKTDQWHRVTSSAIRKPFSYGFELFHTFRLWTQINKRD